MNLKINPKLLKYFKQSIFVIVISFVVFISGYGLICLNRQPKINYNDTIIEKSIMDGIIVGVIDDELEETDPLKQYIVNIKIDDEIYTINDQDLYNKFLYNNVKSELFIVYNRLTILKKDKPPVLLERTIFSIFE